MWNKDFEKTFVKREKETRKKMKKWQIEKSEKSEFSEISEKLFRVFFFPSFRFCPTAKIENPDLKISEKNLRDFWDFRSFRVSTWPLVPSFTTIVFDINYLNKRYLFKDKIYCLDKIYFCFTKINLSKRTLYKLN